MDQDARARIIADFNKMISKDAQDSHLCGLISVHGIANVRPRTDEVDKMKTHVAAYTYKVRVAGKDVSVCKNAFLSLHGITYDRLRRLQGYLVTEGSSPTDQRGRHSNRPSQVPEPIVKVIESHIRSLPARKSHYSLRDNPHRRYLSEDLTVKSLHTNFLKTYFINVPYKTYWQIFKTFNIHFGYPRSDTCQECDSLLQKINAAKDDSEKKPFQVQKELHLRKADAFKKEKRAYILRARQGKVNCISFDFMQNIPLPHLPTSVVYYMRQLWYYVFGVHDLGTGKVVMYRYLENEGKKGPNEVISMLLHFINNIPHSQLTDELVLISDGCPGQNKNKTVVHFLFCLVHILKMFKRVTYLFPVRGHSYLPNDQDFSLISAQRRKTTIAELPKTWDAKILKARERPSPFILEIFTHRDFKDFKQTTERMFLKTPKPPFRLQGVRSMQFDVRHRAVLLRHSYHGAWTHHIVTPPKFKMPNTINLPPAYASPPGVKPAKAKDVLRLAEYLKNPTSKEFYTKLFSTDAATPSPLDSHDYESDNDDNSDGCED